MKLDVGTNTEATYVIGTVLGPRRIKYMRKLAGCILEKKQVRVSYQLMEVPARDVNVSLKASSIQKTTVQFTLVPKSQPTYIRIFSG